MHIKKMKKLFTILMTLCFFTASAQWKNVVGTIQKNTTTGELRINLGSDGLFGLESGIKNQTSSVQTAAFKISGQSSFTNSSQSVGLNLSASGITHNSGGQSGYFNLGGVGLSNGGRQVDLTYDYLRYTDGGSKVINVKPSFDVLPTTQNYDVLWPKSAGRLTTDELTIHKTGNETRTGKLTLTVAQPAPGTNPVNSVAPLEVQGANGSDYSNTTGTGMSGSASGIYIRGGHGGALNMTSGNAFSGNGSEILLQAGNGGIISGTPTGAFPGYGGDATLQAGQSYGGKPGDAFLKAGNNLASGSKGGNIYMVAGWGNNSNISDPLYNGTIFLGSSGSSVIRGNIVVAGLSDDQVNKFQVNGDSRFYGTANADKLVVNAPAPTSSTDVGKKYEIRYDANYIYICIETNTWKRSPLTTW